MPSPGGGFFARFLPVGFLVKPFSQKVCEANATSTPSASAQVLVLNFDRLFIISTSTQIIK